MRKAFKYLGHQFLPCVGGYYLQTYSPFYGCHLGEELCPKFETKAAARRWAKANKEKK